MLVVFIFETKGFMWDTTAQKNPGEVGTDLGDGISGFGPGGGVGSVGFFPSKTRFDLLSAFTWSSHVVLLESICFEGCKGGNSTERIGKILMKKKTITRKKTFWFIQDPSRFPFFT